MYISDNHKVKSVRNKDGTVTYILMERVHEGRWKQVDSITSDKPEAVFIRFKKFTNQLT